VAKSKGDRIFLVAACAGAFLGCYWLSFWLPGWLGYHQWFLSGDVWASVGSASWVASGAIGTVYQANPWYAALPGFFVILAPVVAIAEHLGLVAGAPIPLAHPSMWRLVGPVFFACGVASLPALDYLSATLGLSKLRRRGLLAAVATLVVVPTPGFAGHPEDLLALAGAMVFLARFVKGRHCSGAWALCAAVLMQTWAGLLIPLAIGAAPKGARRGVALRAAGLPALVGALLLALDWPHALLDLLGQPMPNRGQLLPWHNLAGHLAIALPKTTVMVMEGSKSRTGAVLVALGVGWLASRRPLGPQIVGLAAVVTFARGLFEVELWPYYLAPAAVLAAVYGAWALERSSRALWACWVGAFCLYGCAPMAYFGVSYQPWLALGLLLACGGLSLHPVVMDLIPARLEPEAPPPALDHSPQPASLGGGRA